MKKLLTILFVLLGLNASAQLGYTLSFPADGYVAMPGGTTVAHAAGVDDVITAAVNLGFNFQYGCTNYTQCRISSNGFIALGAACGSSYATNSLATTNFPIIAPLWDDLAVGATGQVHYRIDGASPNRIFKVEWQQMEWNYGATVWGLSFQCWLYENGSYIEFRYSRNGNATANLNLPSASIGICGTTSPDFYSLDGVGATPNAVYGTETTTLNSKPATGEIYRWNPVNCSGATAGGTSVATPNSITCPAEAVVLSVTGSSTGCGITYQWQSGPAVGGPFANIVGATTASYTVYPTATTYYRRITTCSFSGTSGTSSVVSVSVTGSLPANDEPCNAITIPVNAGTCTFQTFNNTCASNSEILQPGLAAPGCANYMGRDVWFKVTVPASGRLIVDTDISGLTDCGMAWYTGPNCGNLNNLIECDDDMSVNGAMPMICRTGTLCTVPGDCEQNATLSAGSTVWIRFWDYSGDASGTFDICAYEPIPPAPASTCATATVIGGLPYNYSGTTCCAGNEYTSADACASTYMNGEDYVFKYTPSTNEVVDIVLTGTLTYTGVFVTDKCPNAGGANCVANATSSSGNPMLCGVNLTAGTTYYITVDTYPSPNCTPFSIQVRQSSSTTCNLNYTVTPIGWSWDNISATGTPVGITADDRFAPTYTNIGFYFCYDGIKYTRVLISSNAYIIFDPVGCATNLPTTNAAPDGYSPWDITMDAPNTTNSPRNCIMFPWFDADPSLSGAEMKYQILGASPNRRFVVSFYLVPMFGSSCTANTFDGQVVLYENGGSNQYFDIRIRNYVSCSSWNEGGAIVGAVNNSGALALVPAGYNYSTPWSATFKAWRFTSTCSCFFLPIELLSFSGENMGAKNRLEWTTVTESNNDYFTIEKLKNGEFVAIGTIDGAGNSNEEIKYVFFDDNVIDEVSYYRLKQTDFNGDFTYSDVIAISSKKTNEKYVITPNPAENGEFKIVGTNSKDKIEIFNAIGEKCNNSSLEKGCYAVFVNEEYIGKLIIK